MAPTAPATGLPPPYEAPDDGVQFHKGEQELNQDDEPPQYTFDAGRGTTIPDYDCSVELETRALLKVEFTRPSAFSNCKSWRQIHCQIHGTILKLSTNDRARSLSLQAADAGLAPDYRKRTNVIRMRAEGYQFLLALPSTAACLEWLEKLHAAIAISLPLEEWTERKAWFSLVPRNRAPMYSTLAQYMMKQWRERRSHPSQVWLKAGCEQDGDDAVVERVGKCCRCRKDSTSSSTMASEPAAAAGEDEDVTESKEKCSKAEWTSEHASACVHSETEFAQRCARWLLRTARWRYGWYYSDGERISVLSSTCLPGRHAILYPCSQCRSV